MLRTLFVFSLVTLYSFCSSSAAQSSPLEAERGSLAWLADRARKDGKASVSLAIPEGLVAEPEQLDQVLQHTSVTLARLVDTAVTHDDYLISTWRKYQLLETFSQQADIPQDPLPREAPTSLLPLGKGEFLVPQIGGTITLNGVVIKMQDPDVQIPLGMNRHLMFLLFRAKGKIAVLNYGSAGMFSVDDSDVLRSWRPADRNFFSNEMSKRTIGTLSAFRALAKASLQRP